MRKEQVSALLSHIKDDLYKIESKYKDALKDKTIPDSLRIDIKNLLENLRTILDYLAHDIYEQKIQPSRRANGKQDIDNKKIYFPYGKTLNDFRSSVGSRLPELDSIDRGIYSLIESIQPYLAGDNWLCDFCDITNEKKHRSLIPQERIETNETLLGGGVKVGAGGKVAMRGCLINGIPVNSEDINKEPLENFDPRLKVQRIIWVSFKFSNTNIIVLPFLKKIYSNINLFSNQVYSSL